MKRLTALYFITFLAASFVDGAVVSPELLFEQLPLPDNIESLKPQDLNLTEYALAIKNDHPHAHLNTIEVIERYEYAAESHDVYTSDGYILEVHRIMGNRSNPSPVGKPVVFLMHGLLCSSMDWVLAGPERGFGFILADAGYDVWMGNARGNKYSRRHTNLTVNDPDYWGFSWHEIGVYDLPAMIDYSLAHSGAKKLTYIGHSQGSTTFFVMMTEKPEYNDKIQGMFALAPVVYCSRMTSPIFQFLAPFSKQLNFIAKYFGQYEFKPSSMFFNKFKKVLCTNSQIAEKICMNAMFMFMGFNKEQFDMTLLPAILAHIPAGSSVDQFLHYAQIIKSDGFNKFDYGRSQNKAKYGSKKPPSYNLKNIRVPVTLYYSSNDWLSHPNDVLELYNQISAPYRNGRLRVQDEKFNHIDFLWGLNAKKHLYDKILNIMGRYED